MASAIQKDLLREIKNSRNRFLSIMVLVALAVAFLSGLKATAPDMKRTGDDYLDGQHLMDIQVLSTLGLTEDDIAALQGAAGVSRAAGVYVIDAWAEDMVVKAYSITSGVNDLTVTAGRLPEGPGECVVDEKHFAATELTLGDTLTLTPGGDYEDALKETDFTVVGTVVSPYYISVERGTSSIGSGAARAYVYLSADAFDMDYYTAAYLLVDGAAELTAFYPDYDDYIDEVIDSLEPLGKTRSALRHDELIDEATEKIAEAETELNDAKADAKKELRDAWKKLTDARSELNDGWAEVRDGETELRDAQKELTDAEQELRDAYVTLQENEEKYLQGQKDAADGRAQYEDGLRQYNDGYAEYQSGLAEYQSGLSEAAAGKAKLESGEAALKTQLAALHLDYNTLTAAGADAALGTARTQIQGGIAQCDETITALTGQITQMEQAGLTETENYQQAKAGLAQAQTQKAALEGQLAELNAVSGATLMAAKAEIVQGWADYEAGQVKLSAAASELSAAQTKLAESKKELDDAKKKLDDAEKELSDARAELDDGWGDYYDGQQELSDGQADYADGKKELADARAELTDGEEEYSDGLRDYREGKAEADEKIGEAETELADAKRKVADIESGEWYLFSRSYDPGYTGFGQDADRMANLASVFPVIFFLVAALVCLTTMTRMVEDERTQIGLMKALGYGPWKISRKFLSYGLYPSLLGSALGLAVGYTLFPAMIYTAYQIMYEMPGITLHFYPDISLWATVAAVACTTLSTLWACLATLTAVPANLMRPRAPKPGRRVLLERITPLWKRLSFNWKITTRNLLRYKKRFWMTVIGIGGCTALIIAGFGLRSSLLTTMSTQYGELFLYDAQVTMADNLLESERESIQRALKNDGNIEQYTELYAANLTAESDAYSISAYLEVFDPAQIDDYVNVHDYQSGEKLTLSDTGVLIDQKLSELLKVQVGDTISLVDDGRFTATVEGIYENYVAHFIYLSPAAYSAIFGEEAVNNSLLLNLADESEEACSATLSGLLSCSGVSAASRTADTRNTYLHSMERIDFVVVVVILCAAALAVVVLYNLSNINITERKRELATIKVLGFYDLEVSAYVSRENVILTLVGIALGILFGHYLHAWLIVSVEIDLMMFGRATDPMSYLYAAVLTILFSAFVNVMAHRKMKKIDMVESLKSAE